MAAASSAHTNPNSLQSEHFDHSYYKSTLEILNWASKRIPNSQEVLASSLPTSIFGTVFEDFVNSLGDNPSAKSFIRDIQKASGTIYATYIGAEHGGTGVKYDAGHAYSAILKPSFKTGFIVSAYFVGVKDIPTVSRIANLGGECIARLLANISIKKQELKDVDTEYFDFASNHTDAKLLFQAGTEAVTKTATSDFVGTLIGSLGISKFMHSASLYIETKFINYALGSAIKFTNKDTLFNGKYVKIMSHDGASSFNKVASFAALSVIDMALKTASEVTVTYILAPGVRIVQDGTWPLYKHIKDLIQPVKNKNELVDTEDSTATADVLITPETYNTFMLDNRHKVLDSYAASLEYLDTNHMPIIVESAVCDQKIEDHGCQNIIE